MNGTSKKPIICVAAVIISTMICHQHNLGAETYVDPELESIRIDEKLGEMLPLDIQLWNSVGEQVMLADYFNRDRPVVMVLGYYSCPMLCTFMLNQLTDCVKDLDFLPGREFDIVTVSIDPIDHPTLAAGKKESYLLELARPGASRGWHFHVGEEEQIRKLTAAVGFNYHWNERQQQYAHSAALILLSPGGIITRYLHGLAVDSKQLRMGLLEAGMGQIGSPLDGFFLRCFHYDPIAREYRIMATRVMQAGGVLTVVMIALIIGGLIWKERRLGCYRRGSMGSEIKLDQAPGVNGPQVAEVWGELKSKGTGNG